MGKSFLEEKEEATSRTAATVFKAVSTLTMISSQTISMNK